MVSLLSWFAFPVVAYAVAAGLGLLAGRIARAELPPWLVAPVGLCAGVAVTLPVYKLGGSVEIGAPLLALLAVAGFVLVRGEWRKRLWPGWAGAALLAAYALYLAPVVLSGHWTWLGYNFVNDTSVNLVLLDHVAQNGVRLIEGIDSTAVRIINGTLGSRYPMGLHAELASLHGLVGFLPLESVYQPFIALTAGLAAMAFAGLAQRAGASPPAAAAIGTLALTASLTYQYAAHGSFKELMLVLVIAAAAALSRVILDAPLRAGAVALLGLVLASGLLVFATAAAAYAAMVAAVLLGALLAGSRRPSPAALARAAAVGALTLLVASAAGLSDSLAFGRSAEGFYAAEGGSSTAQMGHLLRPLPLWQSAGVWLNGDYRVPPTGAASLATGALAALAGLLALFGLAVEAVRRRPAALLAFVPCAAVYVVAEGRLGPYATAKLMVLLSPAVVFAAGLGAVHLARLVPRARWAAIAAAAAVAAGILLSDAFAYHDARLAPVERLEALEDAVERAPAQGLILAPEWEEWAKYYGRERGINVSPESYSPLAADLEEYFPYLGHSIDLDQLRLPHVERFAGILLRRGPSTSLPPSSFRPGYRNEWYEVWEPDPDAPEVLERLGLGTALSAAAPGRCQDIRDLAARAEPGEALLAQPRLPVALFDFSARPPAAWYRTGAPGMVVPRAPGRPTGEVEVEGGRHRIWVRGSTGREVTVRIDGVEAGRAVGVNSPEQWLPAGEVELTAGTHVIELRRPGGDLRPGDGYAGELGPVALEPIGPRPAAVRVAPEDADERLCGRDWDWIERIKP